MTGLRSHRHNNDGRQNGVETARLLDRNLVLGIALNGVIVVAKVSGGHASGYRTSH